MCDRCNWRETERGSFAGRPSRSVRPVFLVLAALAPLGALAQPVSFGSADDPLELGSGGRRGVRFAAGVLAGPAYLPDTWRTGVRAEVEGQQGVWSVALAQTVHPGAGGLYGPEGDEAYDALRTIRYVRLNPIGGDGLYARLGPTDRMTLGSGALVRQYRTTTAWDERRVGLETALVGRRTRVGAFTDDVLLTGVVGGEVRVGLPGRIGPVGNLRLVAAAVHDLGAPGVTGDSSLTGVEVTAKGTWERESPLPLVPFVTHARYLGHGSTLGAGLEVSASNIADALRLTGRAALFASTRDFVPGYVGPFYAVSNSVERIIDDGSFFDADPRVETVGTPLDSLSAGLDVVLDLRLVAFGRFEVSQHVRRHLGPDRVSAYGIRLAGRLPGGGHLEFGLERQGFRGFFDLIGSLGDENALLLDVALPVGNRGRVFVRSRYGYRLLDAADGEAFVESARPSYLVERRFEPLVGLRVVVE